MKRILLAALFITAVNLVAEISPSPGHVGEKPGTIEPSFSNQYAISFDGTTEHMTVGTDSAFRGAGAHQKYSYCYWIKYNAIVVSGEEGPFGARNSGYTGNSWSIYNYGESNQYFYQGNLNTAATVG